MPQRPRRSRYRYQSIPSGPVSSQRRFTGAADVGSFPQPRPHNLNPGLRSSGVQLPIHFEEENAGINDILVEPNQGTTELFNGSPVRAEAGSPQANEVTNDGTNVALPSSNGAESFNDEPEDSFILHDGPPGADISSGQSSDDSAGDPPQLSEQWPSRSRIESLIPNWRVLWALLATNGTRKYKKEQYQSIRILADVMSLGDSKHWKEARVELQSPHSNINCLPHYSTLEKKYRVRLLNSLVVPHIDIHVPVNLLKSGARSNSTNPEGAPSTTVRVVMPSDYARADMACPELWAEMKTTALSSFPGEQHPSNGLVADQCVDLWPLVAARQWFYGHPAAVSTESDLCATFDCENAEVGDVLKVETLHHPSCSERLSRCFGSSSTDDDKLKFVGAISAIWVVHHKSRINDPAFCEQLNHCSTVRDQDIVTLLNFVDYKSPSDDVDVIVPPLPTDDSNERDENAYSGSSQRKKPRKSPEVLKRMRLRRLAQKEKQIQIEKAWSKWAKPVIKPGDTITLLTPVPFANRHSQASEPTHLTATDRNSRLCVVHRFWAEREERSRHILFIDGGADLQVSPGIAASCLTFISSKCADMSTNPAKKSLDVRSVTILRRHGNLRGPFRFRPISSIGTLPSGERYFIYRFFLFWDGFQLTTTKQASGDGLYLHCINLPSYVRKSQSSVRILTQSPPGVDISNIIEQIVPDLITGSTEGFEDTDADGNKRRIFLDLVGVLGDTPALNEVLDVLGHTATSCCHLCRFVRGSKTRMSSRYTSLDACGSSTSARRSFFQHMAVRDCGANEEACRQLGMKANCYAKNLPLHSIRKALERCREMTPRLSDGSRILPCILDPYQASLVVPDHLLTGHARDCLNLAYKLLPTKSHRTACENSLKRIMCDAKLPAQNRFFDPEKKTLYSLSMTEMYALAMVAEIGLEEGLRSTPLPPNVSPRCYEKILDAISLVRSCARLIALLWHKPSKETDGIEAVCSFNRNRGTNILYERQSQVRKHIGLVLSVCNFPDDDFENLESSATPPVQKAELAKIQKMCQLAIKTIDRPNVHRLVELSHTTLPKVGHLSTVGELVLEKTHQLLKRALKQTNNKGSHLQSMTTVLVDDWRARLTSAAPKAYSGDRKAIISCVRLLAGSRSVFDANGEVTAEEEKHVLGVLGPASCILHELGPNPYANIRHNNASDFREQWELCPKTKEYFDATEFSSDHPKARLYVQLKNALRLNGSCAKVATSCAAKPVYPSCFPARTISEGNVIEILCLLPENRDLNYPFLLQASRTANLEATGLESRPSLWLVSSLFSVTTDNGFEDVLLALAPCFVSEKIASVVPSPLPYSTVTYNEKSKISFARPDSSVPKVALIEYVQNNELQRLVIRRDNGYPPRCG